MRHSAIAENLKDSKKGCKDELCHELLRPSTQEVRCKSCLSVFFFANEQLAEDTFVTQPYRESYASEIIEKA